MIKGTQVYIITFGLAMPNMEKGALGVDHMDTGKAIKTYGKNYREALEIAGFDDITGG